jgi:hypothetical protein
METATRPGRYTRPSAKRSLKSALWAPVALAEFLLAGYATTSATAMVLVVGGALATAACFLWPILMMAMVFPATYAYWRVGPAAAGMSVTDLLAMLGTVAALPYVPWQSPAFKRALLATGMYAVMLAVSDIAHPTKATIAETGHRFILVMGAICIGAALARLGRARLAMRVMLASSAVVAVVAILTTLEHHLRPGNPFGMQKNSAGVLLTMTFVMLFTGSRVLALPRWLSFALGGLFLAGLAASQSRGSGLALIVVFAVYVMRNGWQGQFRKIAKFAPVIIAASIAILVIAAATYSSRDAKLTGTQAKYNTVGSRETSYSAAIDKVFIPSPVFGGGLKWFNLPNAPGIIPHDLVVSELSEVGLFGTAGFIAWLWLLLLVCRRLRTEMGEMAWYVFVVRILASLVDVFWAAGPGTLPFLVIGLAIGDDEAGTATPFEPRSMLEQ